MTIKFYPLDETSEHGICICTAESEPPYDYICDITQSCSIEGYFQVSPNSPTNPVKAYAHTGIYPPVVYVGIIGWNTNTNTPNTLNSETFVIDSCNGYSNAETIIWEPIGGIRPTMFGTPPPSSTPYINFSVFCASCADKSHFCEDED